MSLRASVLLLLAASGPALAMAPAGSSVAVHHETAHPYGPAAAGEIAWRQVLAYPGAPWVRAHFADFNLAPGDVLELRDGQGRLVRAYEGFGRRNLRTFWTTEVDGDWMELRLVTREGSRGFGVVVDKLGFGFPTPVPAGGPDSLCGADEKQHAKCFVGQPEYTSGQAIGRMNFESPAGSGQFYVCTGWLLSCQDHFMSNQHCIPDQSVTDTMVVRYNYEGLDCTGTGAEPADNYDGDVFITANAGLDFSFMTLAGSPSATYGYLTVDPRVPVVGEPLYLPQHPGGGKKRIVVNDIALGNCRVESLGGSLVRYMCDTEGGSSGSPVLDANHRVIGLHGYGGCPNAARRLDMIWPSISAQIPSCAPTGDQIAVSPGAGPANVPLVDAFRGDGSATSLAIAPYPGYTHGNNVAVSDPDAAGNHDVVVGPGPGPTLPSIVKGYDSAGAALPGFSFTAYAAPGYGANVGGGQIDADTRDEVLTAPGPGASFGPQVRAYGYDAAAIVAMGKVNFYAYGTLKFGCLVSSGELDSDGFDELLTGAGPGDVFGPHVRGFNFDGGTLSALAKVSFFAYSTLKYGVNPTAGDYDNDGFDELGTGPGPGAVFGPQLKGFGYDGTALAALSGFNAFTFTAVNYGLDVASADFDGDGRTDVITGPGPDPAASAVIRGFAYSGTALTVLPGLDGITAIAGSMYGTEVGAGALGI